MGDRRNVVVEFDEENSVALYTHWTGSQLQETVAEGLSLGASRWSDPTYLTRILFCQMVQGQEAETTGFGIEPIRTGSTAYCEATPGYDLIVNAKAQTVYDGDGNTFTFSEFVEGYLP